MPIHSKNKAGFAYFWMSVWELPDKTHVIPAYKDM